MAQNNFLASIMGGGACNPDGSQQMSHSSNPVRNLLQNVFFQQSKIKQMNQPFYPEDQMMHPEHFDKDWEMLTRKYEKAEMSEAEMHKMMQQEWFAAQAREQEMRRMAEFEQKKAWEEGQMMAAKREHEQKMLEGMMGDQWKNAKLQAEVNDWKSEFIKEYGVDGMDKELEAAFEDAQKLVESKDPDTVVKESANYMVDVLENDPDPRFQNSNLLALLKKLQTGEYEIKDNQLIKHSEGFEEAWGGAKEQVRMDKAWDQAKMSNAWEEHKIEAKESGEEETERVFDKIWKKMQAGEFETPEEAELDAEYKKIVEQMEKMNAGDMEDVFADMWNVEQDIQEYHAYGDVPEQYKFIEQNPFEGEAKPLEKAANLLNEGNIKSAILALEAHLQKHPNDGNSWRVLGKLHMDNDEDRPAVRCLLNSVNIDANNLDNLLALGVSCTNILDEVQAMNHLKHWMMNNPKYKHIVTDPNIIPENLVGQSINVEDIKAMNGRLIEHFEKARATNPQDPELATSLAVLYFVARDYKASVALFNEALKYDTNNYSLWNKLGATLAHLGRADEAIEAYNRALEFKPNYVRAWVNLGIANAYKGDFEDGARFYLSALSMNPGAEHVWSYLQTTLMSLQRYDLLKLVANRDLEGFKKEFDIVLPDDLPAPEIEYRQLNEQFLVKQKSENWTQEFNQS